MSDAITIEPSADALAVVRQQIQAAVAANKCHACGCLSGTVEALQKGVASAPGLQPLLDAARAVLEPRKYDCLGCEVCFPAAAANAFSEIFPNVLDEALCPTDAPAERSGWPPLPGDYSVLRFNASVAVCTLNSGEMASALAAQAPVGLAIVGAMHTENLGIERVIRNILANPNIRWLVLCGEDTRQLVGHLPGQSFESLFASGLDDKQRIVGAKGKRPYLKNLTPEHVRVLREQVRLVSLIGERDPARIAHTVEELHAKAVPPYQGTFTDTGVEAVKAAEPQFFKSDPAGFLVVYPNHRDRTLAVEHYTNAGVLDCIIEGPTPVAVYFEIVKRSLVTQLDHAAYLGRELAAAERALRTGEAYVQDRAPGEPLRDDVPTGTASCRPNCATCH